MTRPSGYRWGPLVLMIMIGLVVLLAILLNGCGVASVAMPAIDNRVTAPPPAPPGGAYEARQRDYDRRIATLTSERDTERREHTAALLAHRQAVARWVGAAAGIVAVAAYALSLVLSIGGTLLRLLAVPLGAVSAAATLYAEALPYVPYVAAAALLVGFLALVAAIVHARRSDAAQRFLATSWADYAEHVPAALRLTLDAANRQAQPVGGWLNRMVDRALDHRP